MPAAPIPTNDEQRVRALRALEVLDTSTEEAAFDAISRAASLIFGVSQAGVSLVDADREWFKAQTGKGRCEGDRSTAFCSYTVLSDEVFVVEDATRDDRFRDNPKVTQHGVRFYAGAPIVLSTGERVGAMCVRDTRPRTFSADQRETLHQLARAVASMLEYRAASNEAIRARRNAQLISDLLNESAIVSVTDPAGTILEVNDMFCQLSGYSRDELIGANHRIIKSGVHPDAFWRNMYRTVHRGQTWRGVIQNRSKSGEPYWVQSVIRGFHDEEGRLEKILAVRFDVTDLRMAVRRLRRAQRAAEQNAHRLQRLESLLNRVGRMSLTGGWMLTLDPLQLMWTEETYRIHEVDPGIPLELGSALEFYPEQARPIISDAVERCTRDGTPYDLELPFVSATGRERVVRALGEPVFEDGRVVSLVGAFQDITAQKQAVSELAATRQRLDLALSAAQEGLWDWNFKTNGVYYNDEWFTMLGYEPGELPMRRSTWETLCHPEDLTDAQARLAAHLKGETERYLCEHRLRCRDGSWKWILSVGEAVERDERGAPIRMVGVHIDIDQQKGVQAELTAARRAAVTASRAKSAFLANMSHELRTPLTAIIGFAEVLNDETTAPTGIAEAASIISTNAGHLLTLINDILDLSKVEADQVDLAPTRCRPERFLDDIASMLASVAQSKGVSFETTVQGPVPEYAMLDEVRVRQILVNLVGNAVKFTSAGTVRITLSCAAKAPEAPRLRFEVRDSGIGMTPETLDRIFQPFAQGEEITTRQFGGTGLGLTISRRLAEMMGGDIEVRSDHGVGSAFTLSVPLQEAPAATPGETTTDPTPAARVNADAPAPDSLHGAAILLVEDGEDNRRLLSLFLTKAGAEVTYAENGREGVDQTLRAARSGRPFDLVLMDMQMPVLDGYDATREIRKAGYDRPVIALTAFATSEDRDRCMEAGCDDFLTKPISRTTLIERCGEWIRSGRASARAA
ncbi:MAG: PAS domain-containing protein [Phycisphaerales bacterium JB059]